jgi:hypothetical protein
MSADREPAYWTSAVIDSDETRRDEGAYVHCAHRHRTGPAAALCGARRIRQRTMCGVGHNANPQNLPAVLGYAATPHWED